MVVWFCEFLHFQLSDFQVCWFYLKIVTHPFEYNFSFSFSHFSFSRLCLIVAKVNNITQWVMITQSVYVIIFWCSFNSNRKTTFSRKKPFQLEAPYFDIHMSYCLEYYTFEITKYKMVPQFFKTHEKKWKLPVNLFLDIIKERNKTFQTKFCIALLFQTNLSIVCIICMHMCIIESPVRWSTPSI